MLRRLVFPLRHDVWPLLPTPILPSEVAPRCARPFPYLTEFNDSDDEVFGIRRYLGAMVPHVGGAEHAFHLLTP